MKKAIKVLSILVIFLSFFSFSFAKEEYIINNHDYQAVVNEDGTIDIVETITVSFSQNKHGMIVSLPTTYQKNWQIENDTIFKQYYFPITNIKVLSNQKSHIEQLDNSVKIVFGTEDSYANKQEIYKYSYTMVTRDLDLDGIQMVFLNIVTSGWGTTTENCNFSIQFPKEFSKDGVNIIFPEKQADLQLTFIENSIIGHYDGPISANEGISILVDLDRDYFSFLDFNLLAKNICVVMFILVLVAFLFYLLVGKDKKVKAENIVELSDDLDSSLAGLLIDEQMNQKDLLSLLLYWDNKGYLKIIDEIDDIQLEKIKELDDNNYRYQRVLFKTLFKKGKTVKLSQIKNRLLATIDDIIEDVNLQYLKSKDKLSTNSSIAVQYLMIFTSFLITGIFGSWIYYKYYYLTKNALIIMLIEILVITIISYLFCLLYRKRLQLTKARQALFYFCLFSLLAFNQYYIYYCLKEVGINNYYHTLIFILQVMYIAITMIMRKRNKSFTRLYQKIINIREAIVSGDITDDNLLKELLPYSFAFGLSKQYGELMQQTFLDDSTEIMDNYSCIMALLLALSATSQSVVKDEYQLSSHANCVNVNRNDIDVDSGFGGSSGTSW